MFDLAWTTAVTINGAAQYHHEILDKVDRRALANNSYNNKFTNRKLHGLNHRRKVASLSVFYRMHFSECGKLFSKLLDSHHFFFIFLTARRRPKFHLYVVNILKTNERLLKRFDNSFLLRDARVWNELAGSIFPVKYISRTFKFLLDGSVPPSSSLTLSKLDRKQPLPRVNIKKT